MIGDFKSCEEVLQHVLQIDPANSKASLLLERLGAGAGHGGAHPPQIVSAVNDLFARRDAACEPAAAPQTLPTAELRLAAPGWLSLLAALHSLVDACTRGKSARDRSTAVAVD